MHVNGVDSRPASLREALQDDRVAAALLAALTLLIHLATSWRYGYFGDELYFVACGDHLDWGYVDQPPLIAVIARATRWLLGDSAFALHLPAGVAHAVLVVLAGRMARALGGDRFAQVLAALCVMLGPGFLFTGTVLTMNGFEPLLWLAGSYLLVGILEEATLHRWLLFGGVVGLGLLNKHSMLVFGFSTVVGLLVARPRVLASWRAWAGAGVAVALFAPNLLWEVQHGWVTLEAMRLSKQMNRLPFSPPAFVGASLMVLGPAAAVVMGAGVFHLLSRAARRHLPLGLSFLVTVVVVVAAEGKAYYLLPAYPAVIAAGAVRLGALASAARPALRLVSLGLVVGTGAVLAPLALPLLPPAQVVAYQAALGLRGPRFEKHDDGALPTYLASMIGWENLVDVVARAYRSLPADQRADTAILTNSYGEAGAIDLLGPRLGLPKAISGQETYALWGPRDYTGAQVLSVGISTSWLEQYYDDVKVVAVAYTPYAQPLENDLPVVLSRRPRDGITLRSLWPKLQRFH